MNLKNPELATTKHAKGAKKNEFRVFGVFRSLTSLLQVLLVGGPVAFSAVSAAAESASSPYSRMADTLAAQVPADMVLALGDFLYEDSGISTPFSSLLRQELETALCARRFKIITRERLADLQLEGRFQQKDVLTPGTAVQKVSVEGVQGIVRGRFFYKYPTVSIFTEVACLDGGAVYKARADIAVEQAGASLWPAQAQPAEPAAYIQPQNLAQSQQNIKDAAALIKKVPQDFRVSLVSADGRADYRQGQVVGFKVQAERNCHIAVFCHQSDGSTVLLFPNRYNRDTAIEAGRVVEIPGTHKPGFEIVITPPFGSDVVQVIACTRASALHQMVTDLVKDDAADNAAQFRTITRGMCAVGLDNALQEREDPAQPARWAEDSLIVSTAP